MVICIIAMVLAATSILQYEKSPLSCLVYLEIQTESVQERSIMEKKGWIPVKTARENGVLTRKAGTSKETSKEASTRRRTHTV